MTISQADLTNASRRNYYASRAKAYGQATAFLCHSHKDRELALGLQTMLRDAGVDLYIDWQDEKMPEKPNRETAQRLKLAIVAADTFLFLATESSIASRWCPWEIGYADGKKAIERIMVIPTRDARGVVHGSEYLDLYRRIDVAATGLATFEPHRFTGTPVRQIF